MTTADDRSHFQSYRRQTQVKHTILSKYLPAYLSILKKNNNNIIYLDAFAGRGYYSDESGNQFPGSPILALKLLAQNTGLAKAARCIFVEKDKKNFESLRNAIAAFCSQHQIVIQPQLFNCSFAEIVEQAKNDLGVDLEKLAPTFVFVDPCGIAGADFNSLTSIIRRDGCEAFVFFNIDGLRRTVGLSPNALDPSNTLVELIGGIEPAKELRRQMADKNTPAKRETLAVDFYIQRLREATSAQFFLPYRIEYEDRRATSHYLIHVAKHRLGFRIMKDVMWDAADDTNAPGGLELIQASSVDGPPLFSLDEEVDRSIIERLSTGSCQVLEFTENMTCRPTDLIAPKHYRQRLIILESEGKIRVMSKDGLTPTPADARRKIKEATTLAKEYVVELAT